jgi:pimeloyl-ACP methyl ester carboxylesterase
MNLNRRSALRTWLLSGLTLAAVLASAQRSRAQSDVYFDVTVRQTGKATLHAHVFKNPNPAAASGRTILAVAGLVESASTFGPLAQAFFADSTLKNRVKQVVALNFVAHGESSAPSGLPSPTRFGDLLIEDYIDNLVQAIEALRSRGYAANILIGHSMGGLVVQGAQEKLLAQNSSLAAKGIRGAILLAPTPCAGSPYTPPATADNSAFLIHDPVLGSYLDLPPAIWRIAGQFTTPAGTLVANAPSEAVIASKDYSSIEPLNVLLQLGALVPRPGARQGAFALRNGTVLAVLSFSLDVLIQPAQDQALYTYLLGREGALYRPISASDAVHSMYISNPTGMIAALRELRDFW